MQDLLFLFLGGLIGVVLAVLLEEPLTRGKKKLKRWAWSRIPREAHAPSIAVQCRFGPIELPFVMVDVDTRLSYKPSTIHCFYDDTPIPLPKEFETIKNHISSEEERKRRAGDFYQWPGPTYALRRYSTGRSGDHEEHEINIWLGPSDWFTSLATNRRLDSDYAFNEKTVQRVSLREKYFSDYDWSNPRPQPLAPFSNVLGIVVALVTSDQRLVIVRRPQDIGGLQGVFNIAINEGVHPYLDKADDGVTPNVYRAVIRGAVEELGVEITPDDIDLFGFGVDVSVHEWAFLGVAHCIDTYSQLLNRRRMLAPDKWESIKLTAVPFDPQSVVKFVLEHQPWSPGALCCIYYALVREYGAAAVERRFQN
jgi:hypothetical protein